MLSRYFIYSAGQISSAYQVCVGYGTGTPHGVSDYGWVRLDMARCGQTQKIQKIMCMSGIFFFIGKMRVKLSNFIIVHKDPHPGFEFTTSHIKVVCCLLPLDQRLVLA
jgi:hypothetical protein